MKVHYITGRKCETFLSFINAKLYADKWRDKSISVYIDGVHSKTIHKIGNDWNHIKVNNN